MRNETLYTSNDDPLELATSLHTTAIPVNDFQTNSQITDPRKKIHVDVQIPNSYWILNKCSNYFHIIYRKILVAFQIRFMEPFIRNMIIDNTMHSRRTYQ